MPAKPKLPVLLALIAFASALAGCSSPAPSSGSAPTASPAPGLAGAPPSKQGFYDGHQLTFISTDASDKALAATMGVNYAPGLAGVPAPFIYVVQNPTVPGQLNVFGSEPGEVDYSPIWQQVSVTWATGQTPILLYSDNQINKLQKGGQITFTYTGIRWNCPVIKVEKNLAAPGATP